MTHFPISLRRAQPPHTTELLAIAFAAIGIGGLVVPGGSARAADLELNQIATGLGGPTAITGAGDGSGRLFIAEQPGTVRIFDGVQLLPADFLDITSLVESAAGEQGLLGIAFHPDYENNGLFYVGYSREPDGDSVLARYEVSAGDPNDANEASGVVILVVDQDGGFTNHNGGDMHFGPDGFLYAAFGDDGSSGDPLGNGQNLDTLSGSLIRIDVDNPDVGLEYGIPGTNPFVGQLNVREEIWAYGLRNPWRFSFDRGTGDVFIADVGQNSLEEVNVQPAASTGGENYGWNCKEGTADFDFVPPCDMQTFVDPVIEYAHISGLCSSGGSGSVTGGYRYRGPNFSSLTGLYFYADFCTGVLYQAEEAPAGVYTPTVTPLTLAGITTFGEDDAGDIFLATSSGDLYALPEPTAALTTLAALATLGALRRSAAHTRRRR